MGWLTLLDWQFALSLLLPLAVAVTLSFAEARGPFSAGIRRTVGIVPPFVAAIMLLFGLFTTRLMTDVWEKDNTARLSVQSEDDALRAVLQLANAAGIRAAVLPPVKTYASALGRENPFSTAPKSARADTDKAYESLVAALMKASPPDNTMRATLLAAANDARRARDRRLYVSDDETATIKWVSVLFLGFLTQLTIVLVHVGNTRAVQVGLAIFTSAFMFCIAIVAVFDQPFESTLRAEPGATLAHIQKLE